MRAAAASAILFALALGCANCSTSSEPPVERRQSAATDSAPVVIVLDNVAVRIDVPLRAGPEPATVADLPAPAIADVPGAEVPLARPIRRVKRVVVDAGHGGDNTGATAAGLAEKDVNLDAARRLVRELCCRGFEVTMTRSEDEFVTLEERAEIGNVAGADLFISLHSNAAENPEACGIEVYYAAETFKREGRTLDDAARARDIGTRNLPDGPMTYDGDLGDVVTARTLTLNRDLGRTLAFEIERAMIRTLQTPSRGVKPAGFEVLRWSACPAALVEMGFMTNDGDLEKLSDENYRARLAKAIADAVAAYGRLAPAGDDR